MMNWSDLQTSVFSKKHLTNIPLIALIIANIFPVYGVVVFGWDVFYLVLLYWAENIVIGFYNILKIASARVEHPVLHLPKLFMIPFFIVHFGGFCAIHGIFVFSLFGRADGESVFPSGAQWPCFLVFVQLLLGIIWHAWMSITENMRYGILALFLSHGVSFVYNYLLRGECNVKPGELMHAPYGRVMVMHAAIIFGAFVSFAIGSPTGVLIILIALKTIIDVKLHLRQHKKIAKVVAGNYRTPVVRT